MFSYILIFLLTLAVGMLGYIGFRMQLDIRKLDDIMTNLALTVSQNKASVLTTKAQLDAAKDMINLLSEKVAAVENRDEEKKLEELLEKKWEDAISTISNFDPFAAGEDK